MSISFSKSIRVTRAYERRWLSPAEAFATAKTRRARSPRSGWGLALALSCAVACSNEHPTNNGASPQPLGAPVRETGSASQPSAARVPPLEVDAAAPVSRTSPSPTSEAVQLLRVERYGAQDTARIVVYLSQPTDYRAGVLEPGDGRGPRLYLDIVNARYEGPARHVVGGIVEQVRLGQHEDRVRVVLDLREEVTKQIFYLPEPFRLVIDLAVQQRQPVPRRHDPAKIRRVVLDPGHGGHDPGAVGYGGLQEKDVALDVAFRAAPLIARELDIDALLTRDGDEYVPLDERVARANAFGADLFISIHCNASPSRDSHGVMTFVLDRSADALAGQVAARENAASQEASDRLAHAMRQVMDAGTLRQSLRFGALLQRASMASLEPHYPEVVDGGVRRAGFYVLAGARMPAVLFEASFISNPLEELRLESGDYRQKLADSIVNAIRAYRTGVD